MKQDDTRTPENGWMTQKYLTKDLKVRYLIEEGYPIKCQMELDIEEYTYYGYASGKSKEEAYISALKKIDKELQSPTTYRTDECIDYGTIEAWEQELESVKKWVAMAKRKKEVAQSFLAIIKR